jgi:hypothetical protein
MPAPNKVGEYIHAGMVVVGARMPFFEQLELNELAVLTESLAPDAIARAMREAWARASSGEGRARAKAAAHSWYRMETQARPILEVIQAAANGAG